MSFEKIINIDKLKLTHSYLCPNNLREGVIGIFLFWVLIGIRNYYLISIFFFRFSKMKIEQYILVKL